ncbi:MAG: KH domain-containing protein [Candidatus Methylacidiphilales bacterium]|nr:KH domain-containing protein [Candidatus Methylacidiphilales bacterium]
MQSGYSPRETLELMLGHLGFTFEIREEERPSGRTLHVFTRESARLIGRNGRVIDDLQYLLNRILTRDEEAAPRVIVDVENFRQQLVDHMLAEVREAAEQVRSSGQEVVLRPMNSFERRLVHNLFKDDPDVQSVSPQDDSRIKRITLRKRPASS